MPAAAPIALSIAGSDPTGGAGAQLDVQVFRALGAHGAAVITALTVQNTAGVHQVLPVFPSVVEAQLRHLLADIQPRAIKLGMLATDDVLRAVAHALRECKAPLVVDPVLRASSGAPLLERRALPGLRALCKGAALVAPNLPEAAALVERPCESAAECETAAAALVRELGAQAALVTGGHSADAAACDDCLALRDSKGGGARVLWLRGARIAGAAVHGTGCALTAAAAAGLARGLDAEAAARAARNFVRAGIANAFAPGEGARVLGFGPTAAAAGN